MSKTVFCIDCDEKREYKVRAETVEVKCRGVCFEYDGQIAVCKVCGNELYVPEVNDANVDAALAAYEKVRRSDDATD